MDKLMLLLLNAPNNQNAVKSFKYQSYFSLICFVEDMWEIVFKRRHGFRLHNLKRSERSSRKFSMYSQLSEEFSVSVTNMKKIRIAAEISFYLSL